MPKYIVVVTDPPPPNRGGAMTYTQAVPQRVARITAPTPEGAADLARVPPGGKAEVISCDYVRTFHRAAQAPLVEDDTLRPVASITQEPGA